MPLALGTRLGPYEVTAQIGQGGMGEVYRATDMNLKRAVAIKVLPESFAVDRERVARFQREAEVLASLNHPHIAQIYGLERTDGVTALVLELVEGPTLAEVIAGAGSAARGSEPDRNHSTTSQASGPEPQALSLSDALTIARQIAEALEAAHEQGIIHRDLKPANVKVRVDGTVKVLDFGLAKALGAESASATAGNVSQSPTITTPAMTAMGMILGTAAYMSPEQAKGRTADRRSDVWAFGCVLYEMLTGKRAFDGEDVSDTLAYVLTREPDWSALPAETPAAIHRLLRRSLVKDRRARLSDVTSAKLDIDEAQREGAAPASGAQAAATAPGRRSFALVAGAAVVAALVGVGGWIAARGALTSAPITRSLIGVEPAERLLSGYRLDPSMGLGRPSRVALALSPDGRFLAFTAERAGRVQLFVRPLDRLEATAVEGSDGASNPFFSPDGQWLGFHADGALKKAPVSGGPVVPICKTDLVFGADWDRSDRIVFANFNGGLRQCAAAGGTAPSDVTTLDQTTGESSHRLPSVLPDGQTVLFTVTMSGFPSWDETEIIAQSFATGERKVVIAGGADARYLDTGHLVYVRSGTLMAARFDISTLTAAAPVGVLDGVMQVAGARPNQIETGAGQYALADSGSLVYVPGGVFPQDRWQVGWIDRAGRWEPLDLAPGAYIAPRLSPDETRIAFMETTAAKGWDVFTYDLHRKAATRLKMEGEEQTPIWTPDGRRLTFVSSVGEGQRVGLFERNADGTNAPTRLLETPALVFPQDWSPDGSVLIYNQRRDLWALPRNEPRKPQSVVSSPDSDSHAAFSPDGRWLAFNALEGRFTTGADGAETSRVYVMSYPSADRRELISDSYANSPVWRPSDGRELYYMEDVSAGGPLKMRVMAVPVTTTPAFAVGTPRMLFEGPFRRDGPFRQFDVSRDGQRFLVVREVPRPPTRITHMVLVQNWLDELKRLVPVN